MADEESFVILGTSPTPSMDTINSSPTKSKPADRLPKYSGNGPLNEIFWQYSLPRTREETAASSVESLFSLLNQGPNKKSSNVNRDNVDSSLQAYIMSASAGGLNSTGKRDAAATSSQVPETGKGDAAATSSQVPDVSGKNIPGNASTSNNNTQASMNSSYAKPKSPEPSLAASFILGEIESDVLKALVAKRFPSICSMGACTEDMMKLQTMMGEYLELKKTLINTNITMKQLYDHTQAWKAEVKASEEERREEIAKLRNENLELRKDLDNKIEQMRITEEAIRVENEEFIQNLSDKSAQIKNMSKQIEKLEQQQLAAANQPKEAIEGGEEGSAEYVTTMEHQRIIKGFERQMSAIVAENLELKDMQQNYIDEINCLKANLTAAEELQKKAQEDIAFLKANDVEKSEMFAKFESERKSLRVDLDVLTQQLEIYCRDFKIEQEQRENLANEKDQLLSDLRDLQRKNQELIQEAQKNFEEHTKQVMTATGAFPKTTTQPSTSSASTSPKPSIYSPENNFNCPLCGKIFKTLGVLQTHVNQCLDGN